MFYEIYNSKAQTLARTHPALIATQEYLLSLWHTSVPDTGVSVRTPISYFDRFRIRDPGPSVFTLGAHIDGGSIERWEDPAFRSVWKRVLEGGDAWKLHDPFDISPRLDAVQDLYNAPYVCLQVYPGCRHLPTTHPGTNALSSAHGKGGRHCLTPDPEKARCASFRCCLSPQRTLSSGRSSVCAPSTRQRRPPRLRYPCKPTHGSSTWRTLSSQGARQGRPRRLHP